MLQWVHMETPKIIAVSSLLTRLGRGSFGLQHDSKGRGWWAPARAEVSAPWPCGAHALRWPLSGPGSPARIASVRTAHAFGGALISCPLITGPELNFEESWGQTSSFITLIHFISGAGG